MMESEPKHNFPWQEMDSGEPYLVFKNNGKEFYYAEQVNDMFSETVEKWAIFFEAD